MTYLALFLYGEGSNGKTHLINDINFSINVTEVIPSGKILQEKLDKLNAKFKNNKSYFLYFIAKRRFYEGEKKIAINLIIKSICRNPFVFSRYKDLIYFIRNGFNFR